MVTKAKDKAPERAAHPHAAELAKAVKLVDGGKHAEAIKPLEALAAATAGDPAFHRVAMSYLHLAQAKIHPTKAAAESAEEEAQSLLNQRDHAGALKVLDKAIKAHPKKGLLHYLAATAYAQAGKAEPAAESLKQAMALDQSALFLFRLEPDFAELRKSSLFAFTEND
ncbi:MAG TPA: hypothetical protein VFF77_03575 [Holophagaceae bacterium]|jgi:tetratricopeptide (TPR) repeat protein|nr:hypothetical protein [Holophagaceae bacterium]